MRKLKFRMWDEKYQCWVNDPLFVYPNTELVRQGIIIQQWTGMTDIAGKDIYEGDIINGYHLFGPAGWKEIEGTVSWNNKNGGYPWDYWNLDTVRVIANIFENIPESFDQSLEDIKNNNLVDLDKALSDKPEITETEKALYRAREVVSKLRRERKAQDELINQLIKQLESKNEKTKI